MAKKEGDKIFPKLSDKVIPGRVKPRPSVELSMLKEGIGLKKPKKARSKKSKGFGLGGRGKGKGRDK